MNKVCSRPAKGFGPKLFWDLRLWLEQIRFFMKKSREPRLLICCSPGEDNFVSDLIHHLSETMNVCLAVYPKPKHFIIPMLLSDVIWFEWGGALTANLSKYHRLIKGKKVMIRIHRYEVYSKIINEIDYTCITDVILVAEYFKNLFEAEKLALPDGCKVHIIHNAIDPTRFPTSIRPTKQKIAFVAVSMHELKNPLLMLHAFKFLHTRHPELELHIAGDRGNQVYREAMSHFIEANHLDQAVHFYGRIEDVSNWMGGMDYIFSTSVSEAHPVNILEALQRGLRPLIYNSPGAETLYPSHYLWNNVDELENLLVNGPSPEECRDFIAANFLIDRQVQNFLEVIINNKLTRFVPRL